MRDIGSRIQRYRLSRYASPQDPLRRRLRWAWLALVSWLLWAGVTSDHSFARLWRLNRERAQVRRDLGRVQQETERLERELRDPGARRDLAERELREKSGMARPDEIIYRIREAPVDSFPR